MYFDAVWELILGTGKVPYGFGGSEHLVFAMGSAIMGLLAVLLDWTIFSVGNPSIFNLSYGERPTAVIIIIEPVG